MKKRLVIAFVMICAALGSIQAQTRIHTPLPFFDEKGARATGFETQQLDTASGYLTSVFHRVDDIVWSRVVYRVIDMRYKQNYQLYFPTNPNDPQYRSLFKVMLDAIVDPEHPLSVYEVDRDDMKPNFAGEIMSPDLIKYRTLLNGEDEMEDNEMAEDLGIDVAKDLFSFPTDPATGKSDSTRIVLRPGSEKLYTDFVRNQVKWIVQEIVFFDKHYAALGKKIIAIGPMYSPLMARAQGGDETINEGNPKITDQIREEIMWWVPYDEFRPFMAKQYIIPQSNDTRDVTYEQFFAQHLYTDYLLGDCNMYTRMFSDFAERNNKTRQLPPIPADSLESWQNIIDDIEFTPAQRDSIIREARENAPTDDYGDPIEIDPQEAVNQALQYKKESLLSELQEAYYGPILRVAEEERTQRMIRDLRKEQERVENEILNFEIDLWEY